MVKAPKPLVSARKKPRQARSARVVDDILEAALRVLQRDGPARFTTVHVAEEAGVSVGSLYQYFPSKEALVAALVERHVAQMTSLVKGKLAEVATAPLEVAVRTMIDSMFG